jgi:hypothetical protein
MARWFSSTVMCALLGCSGSPSQVASTPASPDAFAGVWRSVTPTLEFVQLSVVSKSSQMGVLATRLTFSGVAWEGGGRIDGDSLVSTMTITATSSPTASVVVRATDARTLRAQMRTGTGQSPLDLTFVRQE